VFSFSVPYNDFEASDDEVIDTKVIAAAFSVQNAYQPT
jgi:hypothetical protein